MKKLILLLLLSISTIVNAQEFQGKAVYKTHRKIDLKIDSKTTSDAQQEKLMALMKKQFQKTFILNFNKSESIYKEDTQLAKPEVQGGMQVQIVSIGGSGGTDILYKNTKEKRFTNKTEIMGKRFLIKDTLLDSKWELSGETKNIGNYTCYKATYSREVENTSFVMSNGKPEETKKKETIVTTAWYTTEIPVSNGPGRYGGLPGLILEINDGKLTIACTEIVMNPTKKIDIEEPTKGKKITQKKFDKIQEEKSKEMMERFRNKKGDGIEIRIGG